MTAARRVSRGKVLSALQASLKPKAREQVAKVAERRPDPVERSGIQQWDFDALDRVRDTDHGGNTVRAYPALVDDGTTVSIRLMGTPEDQALAHRRGVRRLLLNAIPTPIAYVQEHLTTNEKLALAHVAVPVHRGALRGLHGRVHRRRAGLRARAG